MTLPTWFAWFLAAWLVGAIAILVRMVRVFNRDDLSDLEVLLRMTALAGFWFGVLVATVIVGAS